MSLLDLVHKEVGKEPWYHPLVESLYLYPEDSYPPTELCKMIFIGAPKDYNWSQEVMNAAHYILWRTNVRMNPFLDKPSLTDNPLVLRSDLTLLEVDAIVNPINEKGLGCFKPHHHCVDNLIHRAAGPALRQACKALLKGKTLEPSECFVTKGFAIPAPYIVHALGPIYANHSKSEAGRLLVATYVNAIRAAIDQGCTSLAFPSISTGLSGFPKDEARPLVLQAIQPYLKSIQIVLATWGEDDTKGYLQLFSFPPFQ